MLKSDRCNEPLTNVINANRDVLQATDPLRAGDVVLKAGEKGAPLFEVTAVASPVGHGAYSLRSLSSDAAAPTHDDVPRWQLQPCSLANLLRFSEARWRSLRESTTPKRFLVRAFAGDAFPSAEADTCVARLWECVSLETVEVRPALAGAGPAATVMARPAGWRTLWGRFARGERVRVKGSREMWRVEGVAGRVATLVGEEEGGEGAEARLECVPFEEMTVVGEWARVWHVADVGRARGTSAALRALSGTAESARTRVVVESYLGAA